jgi:phage tail-like protein
MEGTLTSLEDKIANVQMLFDVNSAPAETLEWLADWLGVVLDPVWDERRRRLFIQYAMEFFQYRGTIRGLLIALHMALDSCVDQTVFTQPLSFGRIAARDQGKRKLSGFRIVENFRTRQTPAVVLGDPSDTQGLRVVVTSQRWTPAQGRDSLSQRWQAEAKTGGDFPLQAPAGALAPVWQSFARTALGFIPRANSSDLARWQDFLAGRYGAISALNAAYGLSGSSQYSSFSLVPLPAALPADGSRLLDWYEFEGIILPMGDSAHRFTVMLPAPVQLTAAQRQERLDIAQRVIDLEKPAHTTFRLKFYWAMFRVGEARLGEDTLIDLGSRAPDLMPPFVLGRNYLSEGYLAPGHPQNVDDRLVLNRDRLSDDPNRNQHI